jgi:hypothetical protein
MRGTALFSFEGMNLNVSRGSGFQRDRRRVKRPASENAGLGEIFENCIEKNFHVSLIYESGQRIFNLNALVQFCVVEKNN